MVALTPTERREWWLLPNIRDVRWRNVGQAKEPPDAWGWGHER